MINFAHGDFMMIGMYLAIFIVTNLIATAFLGQVAPFVAALATAPVLFAAGYGLHRFLIARTTRTRATSELEAHQAQVVLTLGIALILQNGALILLGSAPVSMITPLSSAAWQVPLLYDKFAALYFNKADHRCRNRHRYCPRRLLGDGQYADRQISACCSQQPRGRALQWNRRRPCKDFGQGLLIIVAIMIAWMAISLVVNSTYYRLLLTIILMISWKENP